MIVLSPPLSSDLPVLLEWINDPRIQPWVRVEQRKYRLDDLPPIIYSTSEGTRTYPFMAVKQERSVGFVVLKNVHPVNRSALIDLFMAVSARDAIEMGKAIERYAFETLNLNRLEGRCMKENRLTPWLCKIFRARLEGTARQAVFSRGKYRDVQQFALLREEWDGSKN